MLTTFFNNFTCNSSCHSKVICKSIKSIAIRLLSCKMTSTESFLFKLILHFSFRYSLGAEIPVMWGAVGVPTSGTKPIYRLCRNISRRMEDFCMILPLKWMFLCIGDSVHHIIIYGLHDIQAIFLTLGRKYFKNRCCSEWSGK